MRRKEEQGKDGKGQMFPAFNYELSDMLIRATETVIRINKEDESIHN